MILESICYEVSSFRGAFSSITRINRASVNNAGSSPAGEASPFVISGSATFVIRAAGMGSRNCPGRIPDPDELPGTLHNPPSSDQNPKSLNDQSAPTRSQSHTGSLASRELTSTSESFFRNTCIGHANSHAMGRNFGDSTCAFKIACISADSAVYAPILHSPYHAAASAASYPLDSLWKGSTPWVSSSLTIVG